VWPDTLAVVNAVTIRYVAGYSLPSDDPQSRPLPKTLRAAALLLLGALYENREDTAAVKLEEVPFGVRSLCGWYRLRTGMA
jgi:hypothetical protein